MREITITSKARNELIDVTYEVEQIVKKNDLKNGYLVLFVPHTTGGITINEGADPSVQRDILNSLNRIIPKNDDYHHMEGNSDAHIKSSLIGSSVNVLIENNKLVLGTWQRIFFYEGDGPRSRKILVRINPL